MNDKTRDAAYDILDRIFTDSYSGRGMDGEECHSITVSSVRHAIDRLFDNADLTDENEVAALRYLCTSFKEDDMGRGVVVYWPALTC